MVGAQKLLAASEKLCGVRAQSLDSDPGGLALSAVSAIY